MLGLFEKRFEGDDCLLELARQRFQQAGLGAEMHAGCPDELEHVFRFRPWPDAPVTVHLPRDLSVRYPLSRQRIAEFASRFAGRANRFIVHDDSTLAKEPESYVRAAREMEARLAGIPGVPTLFVEYAAGMEPKDFARFFEAIRDLKHVSACIDIGHVGIWQTRRTYAEDHLGQDVCALKSQPPELPRLMPDVAEAMTSALPAVLGLIESVGALGKPIHFHLHDGHPLSTFSPFGVSDHLSFLAEVPLNFEFRGRQVAPLLYGPAGLARITRAALQNIGPERVSFTLEIHPTFERLPLGDDAQRFKHWTDKTNAERMNHWLAVLAGNKAVLLEGVYAGG